MSPTPGSFLFHKRGVGARKKVRQSSGGYPCKQCGTSTAVIDSRPYQQSIRRVRACTNPSCGLRVTTYETEGENPRTRGFLLLSVADSLRDLTKRLEKYALELGEELDTEQYRESTMGKSPLSVGTK